MPAKRSRVPLALTNSTTSPQENSDTSQTEVKKSKTVRRHGACDPCRISKTRCDGAEPCGACRAEKRKWKTCEYSKQARCRDSQNQQVESLPSTSSLSGLITPNTMPKQEQRECSMSQGCIQSQSLDQPLKPSELNMHKVLLLRRVIDEFIDVGPAKGRGRTQINRIQSLWSRFMKSGMTDASLAASCHTLSSNCDGDCKDTDKATLHSSTEQLTPQEKVKMWQTRLDTTLQLVNTGKLMKAWNSVATIMRDIESFDLEHGPKLRRSKATLESTMSICLKLIDLECALSFFVGGGSHLASWTQGRFLSSRIEQLKKDDHLFAMRTSLYNEIQAILQTDVSQREGLWKFLRTVREMQYPLPATELIKISLTTKDDDTAGMQELLLISHLCLLVLCCRTAVVSGHYAEQGMPALSNGPSDIVRQLQLCSSKTKGKDCREVIMHARAVLYAFESLCKIDAQETAQNWFRLCGALIAAILVAVAELRGQPKGEEADKHQLERIKACFEALSLRNKSSPIFENAFEIFHQCETEMGSLCKAAGAEPETESSVKHENSDPTPHQSCAESQISLPIDVSPDCASVARPSTGNSKVNESETPSKKKRRKVAKVKTLEFDVIMPIEQEEKFKASHENTCMTNEHTISERPVAPQPFSRPDLDTTGSFNSSTSTIVDHSLLDGASSSECRLYHLYPDAMSHPPQSIWGHTPHIPYGNDWYWCACQRCSFHQINGRVAIEETIPLIDQAYRHGQANMGYQPYTAILERNSARDCSKMVVGSLTQSTIPYVTDGITAHQMASEDSDFDQARALNVKMPILPSGIPEQGSREYDTMMDRAAEGCSLWNDNHDGVGEIQQNSLQCNDLFPLDDGPRWFPSTMTQQGPLSYAFEQQYGDPESAEMGSPTFGRCTKLAGSWSYRSENEWSSTESSFRDDADASNVRQ